MKEREVSEYEEDNQGLYCLLPWCLDIWTLNEDADKDSERVFQIIWNMELV